MKQGDTFTYYDFHYDMVRHGLVVKTTEQLIGWVQYDDAIPNGHITFTDRAKAANQFDKEGKEDETT